VGACVKATLRENGFRGPFQVGGGGGGAAAHGQCRAAQMQGRRQRA
jgi:hypothetical protein